MGKTAITTTTVISIRWPGLQDYYKWLKSKKEYQGRTSKKKLFEASSHGNIERRMAIIEGLGDCLATLCPTIAESLQPGCHSGVYKVSPCQVPRKPLQCSHAGKAGIETRI